MMMMMMMMIIIVFGIAVGFFIFIGFFWKINWVQDLTTGDKKSLSNSIRRKNRQIGQLPPVYPNGWFGILESFSLKKGQVKHIAALGQNLAVFRTEEGIVRILDAYCPHLGANMAEGGRVIGGELECPFHSWRFCGENGKCTSIPYTKKISSAIKTKVWDCVEANGMIFVWHHAESASPDWYPQPIENIANGKWKYQGRNEFYINCHIQEIAENGADWAHLEAVHGESVVSYGLLSKIMRHSWTNATWATKTSLDIDEDNNLEDKPSSEKHVAICTLRQNMVFFNKYSLFGIDVIAAQIGPGYVELHLQMPFGPLCIIQNVTPMQPMLQKVTHLMFAPIKLAIHARIALIGETIMFKRDVEVWNHKKYIENPMLVNEDKNIKKYRRWYKQFYSENSPTYQSCSKTLDW